MEHAGAGKLIEEGDGLGDVIGGVTGVVEPDESGPEEGGVGDLTLEVVELGTSGGEVERGQVTDEPGTDDPQIGLGEAFEIGGGSVGEGGQGDGGTGRRERAVEGGDPESQGVGRRVHGG